ncbi:MAG: flagellar biosynthetic protein FliO [Bryobacterales bacterium]|nr:flagellar biosynthetic protein FliO [Bryobacterales bacterium]
MRYVLAIGFVLGSLLWLVRRFGNPISNASKGGGPWDAEKYRLERISSLRLGPQQTVHVVGVAGNVYLIGCSSAGTAVIGQLPATVASSEARSGS